MTVNVLIRRLEELIQTASGAGFAEAGLHLPTPSLVRVSYSEVIIGGFGLGFGLSRFKQIKAMDRGTP